MEILIITVKADFCSLISQILASYVGSRMWVQEFLRYIHLVSYKKTNSYK